MLVLGRPQPGMRSQSLATWCRPVDGWPIETRRVSFAIEAGLGEVGEAGAVDGVEDGLIGLVAADVAQAHEAKGTGAASSKSGSASTQEASFWAKPTPAGCGGEDPSAP